MTSIRISAPILASICSMRTGTRTNILLTASNGSELKCFSVLIGSIIEVKQLDYLSTK